MKDKVTSPKTKPNLENLALFINTLSSTKYIQSSNLTFIEPFSRGNFKMYSHFSALPEIVPTASPTTSSAVPIHCLELSFFNFQILCSVFPSDHWNCSSRVPILPLNLPIISTTNLLVTTPDRS